MPSNVLKAQELTLHSEQALQRVLQLPHLSLERRIRREQRRLLLPQRAQLRVALKPLHPGSQRFPVAALLVLILLIIVFVVVVVVFVVVIVVITLTVMLRLA